MKNYEITNDKITFSEHTSKTMIYI